MGAFRGLKVTQDSTAVSESSMWKPKILRQRLVCPRRSCQYSERFLIEVNCNVDTAIYKEKREPELMPPISSHTLRHTGCTRLGENNVNPKVMQYVMGHSDAQITMNVYNHIAEKSHVENEMSKMNLPETVPAVV